MRFLGDLPVLVRLSIIILRTGAPCILLAPYMRALSSLCCISRSYSYVPLLIMRANLAAGIIPIHSCSGVAVSSSSLNCKIDGLTPSDFAMAVGSPVAAAAAPLAIFFRKSLRLASDNAFVSLDSNVIIYKPFVLRMFG